MSDLNRVIEEHVKTLPKLLLRKVVKKKIEDQGIDDVEVVDALTDHVFSGSEETFRWDDGRPDQHKKLRLEFTDEDKKKFEADLTEFIDKKLPEAIQNAVHDSAKSFVKSLNKLWPEQKVEERNDMRYFRDRIDLRWAKTLDPLRILLNASREIGQEFAERLARSKAKKGIVKREAILALHLRACQTTMEILILLENGLADGAYARWRTLYEISVVAFVIDRFGDEVAERYLAHEVVSIREATMNRFRHDGRAYEAGALKGEEKEIEEEFQNLISEFGRSYAGAYGWAAESLAKKAPRFQDLEEAIDWNALPPNYKSSSHKVHASVAGTLNRLGAFGEQPILHAGASNAGIEIPAINAAYSLTQITTLVSGRLSDLENQIKLQSLVLLRDTVHKEGEKAAKRLAKDEMEIRLGLSES